MIEEETTKDDFEKMYEEQIGNFTIDNIQYMLWKEVGTADVISIDKAERDVIIPSHVEYQGKTYPVTSISCTSLNENLKSLTIPDTIESMAISLNKNNIKYIVNEDNMHYYSSDGVLYDKDKTLLISCPSCMIGLFVIPDSVRGICDGAFSGCILLREVRIPKDVTALSARTFDGYNGKVVISTDNVKYAFIDGCLYDKENHTLMKVPNEYAGLFVIPEGTFSVAKNAFARCFKINAIRIPVSFRYDSESLSQLCALDSIEIAEGNENYVLSDGVLYSKDNTCLVKATTAIKEFTVPASVTYISTGAFFGCYQLKKLTIPETTEYIGEDAFSECSALDDVYSYLTGVYSIIISEEYYFDDLCTDHCTLHVLPGRKAEYEKSEQWCDFQTIVEDL